MAVSAAEEYQCQCRDLKSRGLFVKIRPLALTNAAKPRLRLAQKNGKNKWRKSSLAANEI